MSKARPIVVLAFPGGGDPYTDSFYASMRKHGAEVIDAVYSGRWILKNGFAADYAHFHWPSFLYGGIAPAAVLKASLKFIVFLLLLRLAGVRIIWTAHNLYPHERNRPAWVDRVVRLFVCRIASHVVVHGKAAADIVADEFNVPRRKLVLVAHGHFIERYPHTMSQLAARARLGLPEGAYVYAFFGNCRPYKNVLELIACFQRDFAGEACYLVVAGRCGDGRYREEIETSIRHAPKGILFRESFIADQDVQVYLSAADVVVLPFKDVLTSGSAILALSFGKPVIAPRIGCLSDLIDPSRGILYDQGSEEGLAQAMRLAREVEFDPEAIRSFAQSLSWEQSATTLLQSLATPGRGALIPA